jgi:regulatory protein
MPRILTIKSIKRQKAWYEIHFDNNVSFAVNDELLLKHQLKIGKSITTDEIKTIRDLAEYLYLKKKALEILARRSISEKNIRQKLQSVKSYNRHIDKVITELKKLKFIDDYAYAVKTIQFLISGNSRSIRYVNQKLYQKGLPPEIIKNAIDDELGEYDELEGALKLGTKKYNTLKNLPQLKAKKRIADFLQGKGYNWDAINGAINRLFEDSD